jgi:predicted aspartyl protease
MTFPLDTTASLIVVPVRLTGPTGDVIVRLALDTGATITMINGEALVLIGYDPATSSKRLRVTTGSGVEFVPRIAVDLVEALGQRCENVAVLCHTLPPSATVDGVLGLDFFKGKRLVLDFRAGEMSLD